MNEENRGDELKDVVYEKVFHPLQAVKGRDEVLSDPIRASSHGNIDVSLSSIMVETTWSLRLRTRRAMVY